VLRSTPLVFSDCLGLGKAVHNFNADAPRRPSRFTHMRSSLTTIASFAATVALAPYA